MRVAVVGAGGLGGLYGGLLARSGLDVTFIARGPNLDTLREHGLSVKRKSGEEFRVAVRATDDPRDVGPVDLIWFCVKTYDLEAAARQALPLVGPGTMALPIQNGVEAPEQLAKILGPEHALGGVGRAGATLVAPGRVEEKSDVAAVAVGELDGGTSARMEHLAVLLKQADIEVALVPDIRVDLWDKFVQACAIFGLDALLRLPESTYLQHTETAALFRGLMQETYDVGRARGVRLPEDTVERLYNRIVMLFQRNPQIHSSMYYDILAGRPLEIEAASGAVVRLGRAQGVPTPLNFAVYVALRPFADGE
jgi:2-dehydropantoate 2-reductase